MAESSDSLAVARTVADYIRGWREGDVALLREVFAPQGVVMWTSNDGFRTMTFEEVLEDRKPNPGYGEPWRIEHLRVVDGAVAVVEVFIARPERGLEFTDILTLYRLAEGWRIVSKAYAWRRLPGTDAQDAGEGRSTRSRPGIRMETRSCSPPTGRGSSSCIPRRRTGVASASLRTTRSGTASRGIAFMSDRSGDEELYRMEPDGSHVMRLTEHDGLDYAAAWSPDAERIAFVSVDAGRYGIWLMDRNGGNRRLLVEGCER